MKPKQRYFEYFDNQNAALDFEDACNECIEQTNLAPLARPGSEEYWHWLLLELSLVLPSRDYCMKEMS